ncbi:MAG: glycosyltransferase N-terminal domain-containing protein [Bacteroidales bacterium]
MKIIIYIYSFIYCCLGIPVFGLLSLFNSKTREGFTKRFSQEKKITSFALNSHKKTVLFHSSSVGEWEQSIPLIRYLKKNEPDIDIVATFFSPSAIHHAHKEDVDLALYLPFDMFWTMKKFLLRIQPAFWIISKYDIWPSCMYAAHTLDIPVFLTSAELAEDSHRHKGISAKLNKSFYTYISAIFPVSEEYKNRFLSIYPYPERLIVAGDARYEQIIEKAKQALTKPSIELFTHPKTHTIVAGSIWPNDEKHIFPAFLSIYKTHSQVQFILVPHELHESHIQSIENFFESHSIQTERYTDLRAHNTTSNCRIVIVDTIGILAQLYRNCDIAYVGGGFSTGVHNVAEPAAFGNPVLYGPKHINSHEAIQLQKINAGFAVHNTNECKEILESFIHNSQYRNKTGATAQDFLYANKGATHIIVHHIQKILSSHIQNS